MLLAVTVESQIGFKGLVCSFRLSISLRVVRGADVLFYA